MKSKDYGHPQVRVELAEEIDYLLSWPFAASVAEPESERIRCMECGKSVSTEVIKGTIVRAWVECPECIEKGESLRARAVAEPPAHAETRLEEAKWWLPLGHKKVDGGMIKPDCDCLLCNRIRVLERAVAEPDGTLRKKLAEIDGYLPPCECCCCVEVRGQHAAGREILFFCHCAGHPEEERCDCPNCLQALSKNIPPTEIVYSKELQKPIRRRQ